jgi:hypothetical protein
MHGMSSTWAFVRQHTNLTEMVHDEYCELFGPPNELSVFGERIFQGLRRLLGELIGRGAPGYWALHGHGVQAGWFFPPVESLKDGAFSKSNALAPMSEERKRHMRALAFSAPKPMHASGVTPYPALYVLPRGSLYATVACLNILKKGSRPWRVHFSRVALDLWHTEDNEDVEDVSTMASTPDVEDDEDVVDEDVEDVGDDEDVVDENLEDLETGWCHEFEERVKERAFNQGFEEGLRQAAAPRGCAKRRPREPGQEPAQEPAPGTALEEEEDAEWGGWKG